MVASSRRDCRCRLNLLVAAVVLLPYIPVLLFSRLASIETVTAQDIANSGSSRAAADSGGGSGAAGAAAAASAAICKDAYDCELLGTCFNGTCHCSPGFTGATCGQLSLVPITTSDKYQPGKVWPRSTMPYYPAGSDHTTIGWSFAPVYDPQRAHYVAVAEVVCDKWGSAVWLAALSSATPNGPWTFERRLGPRGTNSGHLRRLPNGTFTLVFVAMTSGLAPPGSVINASEPVCIGTAPSGLPPPNPATMMPAIPACNSTQAPSLGHNCLCSRASRHCPLVHSSVYMATSERFPEGPWRVTPLSITGTGWSPYNSTLSSIGTSNPSVVMLKNGSGLLAVRSHAGYWPGIDPVHAGGEHMGFAMGPGVGGPFHMRANLSWQYGNDEDPFVWQQPDGTLHCLYHNGRGSRYYVNHGLHAFSGDGGLTWHKPRAAFAPECTNHSGNHASCPGMYNNTVEVILVEQLQDEKETSGTTFIGRGGSPTVPYEQKQIGGGNNAPATAAVVVLEGRERPALLFDEETGAPTWLFNGAIPANNSAPWYAMGQRIAN